MKISPFISVIIVSYNYAKYLPRALNALINQTFKDYEIIIVNNGSTDNTQEIINKFCAEYPEQRIIVEIVEKNIGLPHGRNVGIAAAKGTYILFNDADDWMECDCLQRLAEKAKETNADRISGFYQQIDSNNNIYNIVTYHSDMSIWQFYALQASMFRRSIFYDNNITCPLDVLIDDLYLSSLFASYTKNNVICNKIIYYCFYNPNSTFTSEGSKRTIDFINDYTKTYKMLLQKINSVELEYFEYMIIKIYYFGVFNLNRGCSYSIAVSNYKKARSIMRDNLPNYLNNKKLTLFRKNGDRPRGRYLTWLLSIFERFHLIYIFWLLFLLVNKIKKNS